MTFLRTRIYAQALALLPTMAFFAIGMHAGYAIYFPELFPTRLRATGSSFCFNLSCLLAAILLLVWGMLGSRFDLCVGVVAMARLFLVGPRPAGVRPGDARAELARMRRSACGARPTNRPAARRPRA
jgi:hypothetical protein